MGLLWARRPGQTSGQHGASKPVSNDTTLGTDALNRLRLLEEGQKHLEETVWAKELLAQQHEAVFIELWDKLRGSADPFGLLGDFDFGRLEMGTNLVSAPLELGINSSTVSGSAKGFTTRDWRQLLSDWKLAGYELAQTEWRQPQFDPEGDSPARSVIALKAHVFNRGTAERLVVTTRLNVRWRASAAPNRPPYPESIQAVELKLISRVGAPAFEHAMSQTFPLEENRFLDPLIVSDLNRDGRSEIILSGLNTILLNQGNGQFQRKPLCSSPPAALLTSIVGDFDGDGIADFLAVDHDGVILFTGTGNLNELFPHPGTRAWDSPERLNNPFVFTAGDIDGDGDLDLWLAQYKLPYIGGQMPTPYDDANDGFPSYLLLNDGEGRFTDGTETHGLAQKRFRRTYSASFVDLDTDHDLDLVVVSDFAGVDVHYNDGRGHFTDRTQAVLDEPRCFGMAHTFGDYNLDGRLDLFAIAMNSPVAQRLDHLKLAPPDRPEELAIRPHFAHGNRLYLGHSNGFKQGPLSDQVAETGWSWGATSFDFDNDGDLDLYVANGHKSRQSAKDYETQFWMHDIYAATSELDPILDVYFRAIASQRYGAGESYGGYHNNVLLLNERGESFREIGFLMGVAMPQDSRNVVSDDLDGDGKLDLLVTTYEVWPKRKQTFNLFRNQSAQSGNWIGVNLYESRSGGSPVGAKITLHSANGSQSRQIVTGDSYRSQHAHRAHFGLGGSTNVVRLDVRWPNGKTEVMLSPSINEYHALLQR